MCSKIANYSVSFTPQWPYEQQTLTEWNRRRLLNETADVYWTKCRRLLNENADVYWTKSRRLLN